MASNVERFRQAAADYCGWVEGAPLDVREDALKAIQLLAACVASVHDLVDEQGELSDVDGRRRPQDVYRRVSARFASMPFQHYAEFANPQNGDTGGATFVGLLSNDLADTYFELREGLDHFNDGRPYDAVFHWRLMYDTHWGRHAASALYALHCWLSEA